MGGMKNVKERLSHQNVGFHQNWFFSVGKGRFWQIFPFIKLKQKHFNSTRVDFNLRLPDPSECLLGAIVLGSSCPHYALWVLLFLQIISSMIHYDLSLCLSHRLPWCPRSMNWIFMFVSIHFNISKLKLAVILWFQLSIPLCVCGGESKCKDTGISQGKKIPFFDWLYPTCI